MTTDYLDLRCDAIRMSGPKRGRVCEYLLFRYQPGVAGRVETKCPRCNAMRIWTFTLAWEEAHDG